MVKLYRDYPEFTDGPLTATVPESALEAALDNGWKIAEDKKAPKEEPKPAEVKEEPKVEKPKTEAPKAEDKPLKTGKKKLD